MVINLLVIMPDLLTDSQINNFANNMPIPLVVPLIASAVASVASAGKSMVDSNRLNRASRQQNAFNAAEAAKDRLWQEKMFDKQTVLDNTAYQRQVSDMQAAGLNPALLYGSGAGSGAATPAAGSGASASSGYAPPQSLSDLMSLPKLLSDLRVQQAEIDNIKADTNLKNTQAAGQAIDNANKPEYWSKQLELMGANASEARANIQNLLQQVKTGAADEALKRANARLTDVNISQETLENGILAYQLGMTSVDAKYYEAMKSFDLALKSATLGKTTEDIKNLRKARALMAAQIITEGSKSKMFDEQANASNEFARMTRKKTSWIDAEELEKLTNLSQNTDLVHYLARKYDAEANYTDMKPLLELVNVLGEIVSQ